MSFENFQAGKSKNNIIFILILIFIFVEAVLQVLVVYLF
jgi:hypothetical protein